jgi:hypothetical protein
MRRAFLAACFFAFLASCYREVRPERPWCGGRGSFWMEGHRNRWGKWEPGHWVCR